MGKLWDVVIVGSGNAALCAGIAACEHGANVLPCTITSFTASEVGIGAFSIENLLGRKNCIIRVPFISSWVTGAVMSTFIDCITGVVISTLLLSTFAPEM